MRTCPGMPAAVMHKNIHRMGQPVQRPDQQVEGPRTSMTVAQGKVAKLCLQAPRSRRLCRQD